MAVVTFVGAGVTGLAVVGPGPGAVVGVVAGFRALGPEVGQQIPM